MEECTSSLVSCHPLYTYSVKVAAETSTGTGPYSTAIYELTAGMILMLLYLYSGLIH